MLTPEVKNLKNQLEDKSDAIKWKLNYFKSIEFEEYQKPSDIQAYQKMVLWLDKINDQLENIIYYDNFSEI